MKCEWQKSLMELLSDRFERLSLKDRQIILEEYAKDSEIDTLMYLIQSVDSSVNCNHLQQKDIEKGSWNLIQEAATIHFRLENVTILHVLFARITDLSQSSSLCASGYQTPNQIQQIKITTCHFLFSLAKIQTKNLDQV